MPEPRVLDAQPVESLAGSPRAGEAIAAARRVDPGALVDTLAASGLRGRGGAGFPTGRKWQTVRANASPVEPTTVVVNAAEGEPGCFKDRTLLRANPYRVLEGALVAAVAVGADRVIVALKDTFTREATRVRGAIDEVEAAGWCEGIRLDVFLGPAEYLYGEETGLLEAIDGRPPFPRIAPPYRRGVDELVETAADVVSPSSSAAHVELAGPQEGTVAPPTLVDNVETLANVPGIVLDGPEWFRSEGTERSPGTIVVTVSGATAHAGVAEVPMGTPLAEVIERIGGGARAGHTLVAAMSGVANAMLPASAFATPLTYEAMAAAGSGLGAAGFLVFDDHDDLLAVAAGASHFLAVESCGQCTPCKQDGLAIANALLGICRGRWNPRAPEIVERRLLTVADSARCNLASQQQSVVGSILRLFPDLLETAAAAADADGALPIAEPYLVAPIVDIVDGTALLDVAHAGKQPDWSFGPDWAGESPAERFADLRSHQSVD